MTEQTARTRRAFWVDPAHDPRDTDELPVDETTTLRQYLDRYRMTFEMKCEGLTPEQLATRSVPPSTMSLLGLVRHLAKIEHHWFRSTLEGNTDLPHLYLTEEDPDLDFEGAVGVDDCVADAWESWRREVALPVARPQTSRPGRTRRTVRSTKSRLSLSGRRDGRAPGPSGCAVVAQCH